MKITRGGIIVTVLFLTVTCGSGGVYFFYLKDRLEEYAQNEQTAEILERRLRELEETFHRYDPRVVVPEVRGRIPEWRNAVERRTGYFSFGDWLDFPDIPEDEILRFWYDQTATEMVAASQQRAVEVYPWLQYDYNLRGKMGVPTIQDLTGREVTDRDVRDWLSRLAFGLSSFDFLVANGATSIQAIEIWPVRQAERYRNLLNQRTVGLQFTMTLQDLTSMLETLRSGDRYFHVDGIRIEYPFIAQRAEPQLNVEMLLTQARATVQAGRPGPAAQPGAAAPGGAQQEFQRMGMRREPPPPPPEPSIFERTWTWIKRNIFYTN